uniref:Uncharacterized protein n=1 Tax=Oryza meridionalis TaxID=40149 RepID=A0A0E0E7A2_9ORYZ
MSPPLLLLRALTLAGRKAAARAPRPRALVLLAAGAHGTIRATSAVPPPCLPLRALSSRAGEVDPRPRPRPEEIIIGGGADMVSPTAAASGGGDAMVGVGMSAPWLIGAAGASANATIKLGSDPAAARAPRPRALVLLAAGAHGTIRATSAVPPPCLPLRALSSRAGEVDPRPRPRPEEIIIGGGADMVSPTAAASGGGDAMVGVGMSAPWLIGAAGASANATIKLGSDPVAPATARQDSALLRARHLLSKAEQHHLAARHGYGEGEGGSSNPRPRVAAALVCLVVNLPLPAIQGPEFVVLEADDSMVELIRDLIVAGGGHPEHRETTGGFVSLAPCVFDDARDKKTLPPSSGITNVSCLATANGIKIMMPAQSASKGSRRRLFSMQTTRCLSSAPNVSIPDDTSSSANGAKRRANRIRLVDVSVRVTELEQLVRSLDKRLEDVEAKWDANLRIAELRADIAEKRADQLEKLLEKTVEGMERMVNNKMEQTITWVLQKNFQQEELAHSRHSSLLLHCTQLAQEMAATKDELYSVRRNYRDDILTSKFTVSITAWRIVLVLLGGFGGVTAFYVPYVIKDIKLETCEEVAKRISEMLQGIADAIKELREEVEANKVPWWRRLFKK